MSTYGIAPEDILQDTESFVEAGGLKIRKGSVAAFLKNIDLLEDAQSTEQQKSDALAMIKTLAPAIIATGLHRHAAFKNEAVKNILDGLQA